MGVQYTTLKNVQYVDITTSTSITFTPDNFTIAANPNYILGEWDKLSSFIGNPFVNLLTEIFDLIISWYNNIFDFISIFFLLNFWLISFLIFIQGWELLINHTSYFNNKVINNGKSINIISTKLNNSFKGFIQYYV